MNTTELYCDDKFDDILVWLANKKRIADFDDFKQDVFLDIINSGYTKMADFKKSANRVASRYYDTDPGVDASSIALYDESGVIESEDETMSRLIYNGKAWQVG